MKHLRLCVVVLLVLLLPIRGAMAAAMLCPPGSAAHEVAAERSVHEMHADIHGVHEMNSMNEASGADDMGGMRHMHDMTAVDAMDEPASPPTHEAQANDAIDHAAGHAESNHHQVADAAGGHGTSDHHSASCHYCASGCCMASIVGALPPIAQPARGSSVVFPLLAAPVPAFESDGQERPPRTI